MMTPSVDVMIGCMDIPLQDATFECNSVSPRELGVSESPTGTLKSARELCLGLFEKKSAGYEKRGLGVFYRKMSPEKGSEV